jgi:hypothetical protein
MSIHFFCPRSGVASWERTYRSESPAIAKSNAAAVSRQTALPLASSPPQTGPNTPRSRGLSKQPHTSPASQGQANDTLPDGCQGSLSLRLALLRRSSTRFSRETEHESRGRSASRTDLKEKLGIALAVAVGEVAFPTTPRDYSSRLSCFPNNFGEGEC